MKLNLKQSRHMLAALLTAVAVQSSNAATPVTPVLTNAVNGWDCLMSGQHAEKGIVYLSFHGDGYGGDDTFNGVLVEAKTAIPKVTNVRLGTPSPRDPGQPDASAFTNIFGSFAFNGKWAFDAKGYVVGWSYSKVYFAGGSTNGVTNQLSFKAKVSGNKLITGTYSSGFDNGTIRGVPIKVLTNLSGSWTGEEKNLNLTTYEWFALSPTNIASENWPNVYAVDGYGPSYHLGGIVIASSQKQIGFGTTFDFDPTNSVARATTGTFINRPTSVGGITRGVDNFSTNVVTYNAYRVSGPVPPPE